MYKLMYNENEKLYYVVNMENGKQIISTENKATAETVLIEKKEEALFLV